MKKKIVIVALCVVVVAIGTLFGILKSGANVGASEQQSSVTSSVPSVESSNDIGALFPKDIQITYSSFAPLITEDQAVATARIGYLPALIMMSRTYRWMQPLLCSAETLC